MTNRVSGRRVVRGVARRDGMADGAQIRPIAGFSNFPAYSWWFIVVFGITACVGRRGLVGVAAGAVLGCRVPRRGRVHLGGAGVLSAFLRNRGEFA